VTVGIGGSGGGVVAAVPDGVALRRDSNRFIL
jgi:hypothetical protein